VATADPSSARAGEAPGDDELLERRGAAQLRFGAPAAYGEVGASLDEAERAGGSASMPVRRATS
jgi:hypothetical protein